MRANDILSALNEDSSDISVDALLSFVKSVADALGNRDVDALESMKDEMDSVFADNGNSLVQAKRHLIDNAVAIIGDLRAAERNGG